MRHAFAILWLPALLCSADAVAPSATAQRARGAYLVERVALCWRCHTPRDEQGVYNYQAWLHGGRVPYLPASDAPSDNPGPWAEFAPPLAGLPGWEDEDFLRLMTEGVGRNGGPPHEPMPAFALDPADAAALLTYLRSLPAPGDGAAGEDPAASTTTAHGR
jgi:mono/diheme cytochrome c family protein